MIKSWSYKEEYKILRKHTLTENTSREVFTGSPLVLEPSDAVKATASSADSIHFGISYMSVS